MAFDVVFETLKSVGGRDAKNYKKINTELSTTGERCKKKNYWNSTYCYCLTK